MAGSLVSVRQVGSLLLLVVSTTGCGQSGPGIPASPVAPSASTAATSAASSGLAAVSPQSGPGASYDASGPWSFIVRSKPNGDILDEFEDTLTQDAAGNLTNADRTVTFTRRGTGVTIAYDVSVFEAHSHCNTVLSGNGTLHTKQNTLKVHVSGIEQDCQKAEYWVTATKN